MELNVDKMTDKITRIALEQFVERLKQNFSNMKLTERHIDIVDKTLKEVLEEIKHA